MTCLSKRQQASIDAGQMDLFMIGTMSPHQRLTVFDKAPRVDADDFAAIPAQEIAKRALEIAAVADHSLQFVGEAPEIARLIKAGRTVGAHQCFHSRTGGQPLDLNIDVRPTSDVDLRLPPPAENSAEIKSRVDAARPRLAAIALGDLDEPAKKLLTDASVVMRLDREAVKRALSVARSIAALAEATRIGRIHIAEALSYARQIEPPPAAPEPEPQPAESEQQDPADHFFRMRSEGREIVSVDPKRLDWDKGDIRGSYSADTLAGCNSKGSTVRKPFKFRGGEWVSIGGGGKRDHQECYRLVAPEAFDGPSAPYSQHDFGGEQRERFGGYHGMSAKQGGREVVLCGPPVFFVAGKPEQDALL